jgi:hypothetical protein
MFPLFDVQVRQGTKRVVQETVIALGGRNLQRRDGIGSEKAGPMHEQALIEMSGEAAQGPVEIEVGRVRDELHNQMQNRVHDRRATPLSKAAVAHALNLEIIGDRDLEQDIDQLDV